MLERSQVAGVVAAAVMAAIVAVALSGCSSSLTAATRTGASARTASPAPGRVLATSESTAAPKPVPASIADLPVGPGPRIPYMTFTEKPNGQLGSKTVHVGGRAYPMTDSESAGETVLSRDPHGYWWTVRRGRAVRLPYLGRWGAPALSPNGTRVLRISEPLPGTLRLAVYDVRTDAEIAEVDTVSPDFATPTVGTVRPRGAFGGFDAAGTVYVACQTADVFTADVVLRWRPGIDARPVTVVRPGHGQFGVTPAGLIYDPSPTEQQVAYPPRADDNSLWTARADGSYGPARIRLPTTADEGVDVWSPDGRRVSYSDGFLQSANGPARRVGPPSLLNLRTGVITPLGVPADARWAEVQAFEDATHVLVFAGTGPGPEDKVLLRCPTDGDACERVPTPAGLQIKFSVDSTLTAGIDYDAGESH